MIADCGPLEAYKARVVWRAWQGDRVVVWTWRRMLQRTRLEWAATT